MQHIKMQNDALRERKGLDDSMKTVLITSKEFGSQINGEHKLQLEKYFDKNGWHIIWNNKNAAMTAFDIVSLDRIQQLNAILVYSSSDEISKTVFGQCHNLKVVSRHGVGIENIDIKAARDAGVQIRTTADIPGYETVADLTMALLLAAARKVPSINEHMKKREWYRPISSDVWGKTIGIIGLGRIGRAVIKRARGFDMNVLVNTRHPDKAFAIENNVKYCSKEELLAKSDFVSLHCALNDETRHIIDASDLALMKPTSYLINTARAGLINQLALLEAAQQHKIAGVAMDVFEKEPVVDDPIINARLDNVIVTAHVGSYTVESLRRMDFRVAQNIVEACLCI